MQLELDMGNGTVGFEIIIYWDVQECGEDSIVIAVYTYSGGSINFCDEYAGSILATIRNNLDQFSNGMEEGIKALVAILDKNYSASVSGLLLLGNDKFTSIESYEGLFVSMYGSMNHVKGACAFSDSCVAIAIGGTSSATPSWGISVTNYTLRSAIKIGITSCNTTCKL